MTAALPGGAIAGTRGQSASRRLPEDPALLCPHGCDHVVDPVELAVHDRALDLRCARAVRQVAGEALLASVPVAPAGVDRALDALGEGMVVGYHRAPFATAHVLVVIEAECADVADRAEHSALVGSADALPGVLDHQQVPLDGDRHDRFHVAGQAPHVDRDHCPARSPRCPDRCPSP